MFGHPKLLSKLYIFSTKFKVEFLRSEYNCNTSGSMAVKPSEVFSSCITEFINQYKETNTFDHYASILDKGVTHDAVRKSCRINCHPSADYVICARILQSSDIIEMMILQEIDDCKSISEDWVWPPNITSLYMGVIFAQHIQCLPQTLLKLNIRELNYGEVIAQKLDWRWPPLLTSINISSIK